MNNSKRIEQLWKENSHIPFMQSKEILAYGYNKAAEDFGDMPKKEESKENKSVYDKFVEKQANTEQTKENKSKVSKKDKMLIEMNLLSDLQSFMQQHADLSAVYLEIEERLNTTRKNLSKSIK